MASFEHGAVAFLIGFAVLVILAADLYKRPFVRCRYCAGKGTRKGSTARIFGTCWRCGGSGRVQRLGSRSVHRLAWALRGEWSRSRARRAARKAAERSMHPRDLADRDR